MCTEPGNEGVMGPVQQVCCAEERIENEEEREKEKKIIGMLWLSASGVCIGFQGMVCLALFYLALGYT